MAHSDSLEPPPRTGAANSGAHQQSESSDEEDQFTDAQSGPASPRGVPPGSKMRIPQVDDASFSNQALTPKAHSTCEQDIQPDQLSLLQDSTSAQPSSSSVPITGIENTDSEPSSGHVSVTLADELSENNAQQDEIPVVANAQQDEIPVVVATPLAPETIEAPVTGLHPSSHSEHSGFSDSDPKTAPDPNGQAPLHNHEEFGDDFDDFEEGAQDDDFGDFDDGFEQPRHPETSTFAAPPSSLPFPILDLNGLSPDDVMTSTAPILDILFPPELLDLPPPPPLPKDSSLFITPRSAPLWSQLVAPPPLAPPDWIRSRTRRLFLVSLGVPVDLDEILPASKQKKLILPSLSASTASPRNSTDSPSASHLRQNDANASSTSLDSQGRAAFGGTGSQRRKGPPPQPELDLVAARYLCTTTDEALNGMTDQELKDHVAKLESMRGAANNVLEYWKKRADEKIGDREAFEGVIENLVKHARKVRQ